MIVKQTDIMALGMSYFQYDYRFEKEQFWARWVLSNENINFGFRIKML